MSSSDLTLRQLLAPIVREVLAERESGPLIISQRNVEGMLGISPRMHLEFCRREDFTPQVIRAGQLRLVDAREYVAWLRLVGTRGPSARAAVEPALDGADAVLAELGLVSIRPAKPKPSTGALERARSGARNVPARRRT